MTTCKHENVGTVDDPRVYECLDCGAQIPRSLGALDGPAAAPAAGKMTKQEAVRRIYETGNTDASFVLNLIQNWHGNSAAMIKGLANLVGAGHEVRTAQHDLSVLIIDGVQASWCVLSEWQKRTR